MCKLGFSGRNCENNDDNCTPNPCKNGGICKVGLLVLRNCRDLSLSSGLYNRIWLLTTTVRVKLVSMESHVTRRGVAILVHRIRMLMEVYNHT